MVIGNFFRKCRTELDIEGLLISFDSTSKETRVHVYNNTKADLILHYSPEEIQDLSLKSFFEDIQDVCLD